MLSIRFDNRREWWINGKAFDRLFESAVDRGHVPAALAHYQHVANANGGFSFDRMDPEAAVVLKDGLLAQASIDYAAFKDADPSTDDGSYRVSLGRLLGLFSDPSG
mgnify:CR=1 FL=1